MLPDTILVLDSSIILKIKCPCYFIIKTVESFKFLSFLVFIFLHNPQILLRRHLNIYLFYMHIVSLCFYQLFLDCKTYYWCRHEQNIPSTQQSLNTILHKLYRHIFPTILKHSFPHLQANSLYNHSHLNNRNMLCLQGYTYSWRKTY